MVNLETNIGGLILKNPVLLASGTVGYGEEISEFIELSKVGAIVTKSVSLNPKVGNRPNRVVETPGGMLNSIGLANIGLERFLKEKIPFLKEHGATVICNIAADSVDEYVQCVKLLNDEETIKAFEINVSCPNVKEGGLLFGNNLDSVSTITAKVREATEKPVFVKLSPNVSEIWRFAKAVKDNGGDGVSAINTLVGASIDIYSRKPKLNNVTGGLSGPAIKPIAIAKILEIRQKVDIPVIGLGGISNWEDAVEFLIAGASAVQLGTINFVNPYASLEILNGLKKYCEEKNIVNIADLIGSLKIEN